MENINKMERLLFFIIIYLMLLIVSIVSYLAYGQIVYLALSFMSLCFIYTYYKLLKIEYKKSKDEEDL
jgi:hypothetical protein